MAKRLTKKVATATDSLSERLRKAMANRSKDDLIAILVELAKQDRNVLRCLETRFELEAPPTELVVATRQAIADATAFDERYANDNFDYDHAAYDAVKSNLARLVKQKQLRPGMELSLELMAKGSRQVEMSDEGLMTDEIEECLMVVVNALAKSDLPPEEKLAWCAAMTKRDRVGFICDDEIQKLQNRVKTARQE